MFKHVCILVLLVLCFELNLPCIAQSGNVVSKKCSPSESNFKWTLEKMLLATPMPMTAEGRKFFQAHRTLESIQSWSLDDFKKYGQSQYGKKLICDEAIRWRGLVNMLMKQAVGGARFLKTKTPRINKPESKWQEISSKEILSMLEANKFNSVFEQMKRWRLDIATLASKVESLRKLAKERGVGEKFEHSLE